MLPGAPPQATLEQPTQGHTSQGLSKAPYCVNSHHFKPKKTATALSNNASMRRPIHVYPQSLRHEALLQVLGDVQYNFNSLGSGDRRLAAGSHNSSAEFGRY